MRKPLKNCYLKEYGAAAGSVYRETKFYSSRSAFLAGTLVATASDVRTLFLAWVALAILLLTLGRLTAASQNYEITAFISATDQEAAEGYFAFGQDAMVVVKQGSGLQRWLKAHTGERVRFVLTTDPSTEK